MPFHVEISAGVNHARAFNLDADELRRTVLQPWISNRPVELGEKEWLPGECSLRVLEGKRLEGPDLSFGQGWANAERRGEDVTGRELGRTRPAAVPDAFVLESELPEATVAALLEGQAAAAIPFEDALRRIDGRDPEIAAVVLVVRRPGR